MDLWTMRCRAPGRLPWKSLATFPPRVPSPTSSTELYSIWIESPKVKTTRDTGHLTTTGRAPLSKADFLSKQTAPPRFPLCALLRTGVTGIQTYGLLFAMQQFGGLRHIGDVRRRSDHRVQ